MNPKCVTMPTRLGICASAMVALCLGLLGGTSLGSENRSAVIQSATVDGRDIPLAGRRILRLPSSPGVLSLVISGVTNADQQTLRIRHRLDGYEAKWQDGSVFMYLALRFFDKAGKQVAQTIFRVEGESPGWRGSIATSSFSHRRELVVVPLHATGVWAGISSAGPPTTVGFYAVKNLVVWRTNSQNPTREVLLQLNSGFDAKGESAVWIRDGLNPAMASVFRLARDPTVPVIGILDDDPNAHAEWHTVKEFASVVPGQRLLLDWDEMFSMGEGIARTVDYNKLPPGDYRFRVVATTPLGVPVGVEESLAILVPAPYWRSPWFWWLLLALGLALAGGWYRYFAWQAMRRDLARSENQRLLERERLRIAQNIHDDLGARVTQISLVSGLAQSDLKLPEKARADFDVISRMSRELVSALYETVWAVSPENDNLEALGGYICQMVDNLCEQAHLRRRFRLDQLSAEVHVPSHVRHNLCLAVKEAVHNVLKHAKASEVSVEMELVAGVLGILVKDDGCGFAPVQSSGGNGLANMRRRLAQVGGSCLLESNPGAGTTVSFRANINSWSH